MLPGLHCIAADLLRFASRPLHLLLDFDRRLRHCLRDPLLCLLDWRRPASSLPNPVCYLRYRYTCLGMGCCHIHRRAQSLSDAPSEPARRYAGQDAQRQTGHFSKRAKERCRLGL